MKQLKSCPDKKRPVQLMIQAWGKKRKGVLGRPYPDVFMDGHWVAAIGHNRARFFFEDPSMEAIRGFLSYEEPALRRHDVGPKQTKKFHYGPAVWTQAIL